MTNVRGPPLYANSARSVTAQKVKCAGVIRVAECVRTPPVGVRALRTVHVTVFDVANCGTPRTVLR